MCYKHIVGFSKKGVHVINYRTTKIIVEQASESAQTRVKEDYFFFGSLPYFCTPK
jgi:hypothetical protein